jgi:pimeloyl-ACP methyl ester carboxylesterase
VAEKVVVFLHGFQDCSFSPEEKGRAIKERLAKGGWTVYSLSYSEGKPTRQSLNVAVTKLAAEIDKLGLEKIDVVIGHSMGGLVACDFARSYRKYGIRTVIMLETPILGLPAWLLRLWRFFSQRQAEYSWLSIQNMRDDGDYIANLNKDWPAEIRRFEIAGNLSVKLKRFYRLPQGILLTVFPKVEHDGPTGLRGNPEVLDYIARTLECLTIPGYYP